MKIYHPFNSFCWLNCILIPFPLFFSDFFWIECFYDSTLLLLSVYSNAFYIFPWSCFGIKRRIIIHTNVCFIIVHYNSLLSTHTCLGKHGRVYGDGFPGVRRWWFCVTMSTVKPSQPDSGLSTWSPQKRTQYKVVFLVLRRQQVYKCWELMGTELLEAASGVSFWHHVEQSQRAQG